MQFDSLGESEPLNVENPASKEMERELELECTSRSGCTFHLPTGRRGSSLSGSSGSMANHSSLRCSGAIPMSMLSSGARCGGVMLQIIGGPEFHALHWEALKDPKQPHPLAVDQPLLRKNRLAVVDPAQVAEAPERRVLLVTDRPSGKNDVGYRTI
ncbi:MAG: hypothetical protein HGB15_09610 [Chlorobaculum sp.]|nr:hypothetical protein [Chlorobaculum sp.]